MEFLNTIKEFRDDFNFIHNYQLCSVGKADAPINFMDLLKQEHLRINQGIQALQEYKTKILNAQPKTFNHPNYNDVIKNNNLSKVVHKNGNIDYKRLDNGKNLCTQFSDKMIIKKAMTTPENVKTFLELSVTQFGNHLEISGNKHFKNMVVNTIAQYNLPISLNDYNLQKQLMEIRANMHEQNIEATKQSTINANANANANANVNANVNANAKSNAKAQNVNTNANNTKASATKSAPSASTSPQTAPSKSSADQSNSGAINTQNYAIKFVFDPANTNYKVLINGESAKNVLAKDKNALSALKNHPDIKKYQVPLNQLQTGVIAQTDAMKGGNRPRNLTINSQGKIAKAQAQNKSQAISKTTAKASAQASAKPSAKPNAQATQSR